jgi:hypothetical protein
LELAEPEISDTHTSAGGTVSEHRAVK